MKLRAAGVVLFIATVFLLWGIIANPWWWYQFLDGTPLRLLIDSALGEYQGVNVIALAIILFASWLIVSSIEKLPEDSELRKWIYSSRPLSLVLVPLACLACFRLFSFGIDRGRKETSNAIQRISNLTVVEVSPSPFSSPVEFVFMDSKRIEDQFAQIEPQQLLAERTLEQKRSDSDTTKLGNESAFQASRAGTAEISSRDTYKTTPLTIHKKLRIFFEEIARTNRLVRFSSTAGENPTLRDFELFLARTSTSKDIELPHDLVNKFKTAIAEAAVAKSSKQVHKSGSYCLVSSECSISVSGEVAKLQFSVLSSAQHQLSLTCTVPKSGLDHGLLSESAVTPKTDLKAFGVLTNVVTSGNERNYTFIPYAIFR